MQKPTNVSEADWEKLVEVGKQIVPLLNELDCINQLSLLSVLSGVLIDHLAETHRKDPNQSKDDCGRIVVKAFAKDVAGAIQKAESLKAQLQEAPFDGVMPDFPSILGKKNSIVH